MISKPHQFCKSWWGQWPSSKVWRWMLWERSTKTTCWFNGSINDQRLISQTKFSLCPICNRRCIHTTIFIKNNLKAKQCKSIKWWRWINRLNNYLILHMLFCVYKYHYYIITITWHVSSISASASIISCQFTKSIRYWYSTKSSNQCNSSHKWWIRQCTRYSINFFSKL